MSNVIFYDEHNAEAFVNDLKYWSNSGGELHHFGKRNIEKEDLPAPLQRAYKDLFQDNKDGHFMYLVNYMGEDGIALVTEYHESLYGSPSSNNFAQAE